MLEEDIILSKRSRSESVSNNDVVFEYDEGSSQEAERTYKTIGTIESLRESEMISEKGCLTLRADCIREVVMKHRHAKRARVIFFVIAFVELFTVMI